MRRKCKHCEERKEITSVVPRYAGGNYRRAGRFYNSAICFDCAKGLVKRATPGARTVSQWDIIGLQYAIAKMKNEITRSMQ